MKNDQHPVIVGAGLAGLIAAHAWQNSYVIESGAPGQMHNALLRFRTEAVSHLTGIEFKKVKVRKAIYANGEFHQPNIALCNSYALKVAGIGGLAKDRSIWNVDPVERYIAPENFYERLIDRVGSRVVWDQSIDFAKPELNGAPIISTAPMNVVLNSLSAAGKFVWPAALEFKREAITVTRWRIPGADLYQTVYFPGAETNIYRASITGSLMIIESVGEAAPTSVDEDMLNKAFGLHYMALIEMIGNTKQKYGKIAPMEDDAHRRRILYDLTQQHDIYSLGRFATWRNILLDDVVDDIRVIKRLMESDAYGAKQTASK